MSSVSAVILTFNEAENIEACLESVKWANEIILVDSFSTDKTVEIAKRYSAKVFQKEWEGFAADKDFGIGKVTSEWIILIDADERVSGELREKIEEVVKGDSKFDGYFVPRKNYFLARWIKHCGWYPNYMLRLFREGKGRHDGRKVHERIKIEGRVGYLKEPLLHYTYKSISDYLQRFDRYTSLEAEEMAENNARLVWLFPFKETFEFLRKYSAGLSSADKMSVYLLAKEVFKNRVEIVWLIPFKPILKFVRMYVLRLGFLDGYPGFIVCTFSSVYGIVKYAKFCELKDVSRT